MNFVQKARVGKAKCSESRRCIRHDVIAPIPEVHKKYVWKHDVLSDTRVPRFENILRLCSMAIAFL